MPQHDSQSLRSIPRGGNEPSIPSFQDSNGVARPSETLRRESMGQDMMRNQALAAPEAVEGTGGYVYQPDGEGGVTLLHDPTGQATGVTLSSGDAFDAIKAELLAKGVELTIPEPELPPEAEAPVSNIPGQVGDVNPRIASAPPPAPVDAAPPAEPAPAEEAPPAERELDMSPAFGGTFNPNTMGSTPPPDALAEAPPPSPDEARASMAEEIVAPPAPAPEPERELDMSPAFGGTFNPNTMGSTPPPDALPPIIAPGTPGEPGDTRSVTAEPAQTDEEFELANTAIDSPGASPADVAAGGEAPQMAESEGRSALEMQDGPEKLTMLEEAMRKILGLPAGGSA